MISGAPALMFSNRRWLILTMSPNLWVRSSSLLSPDSRVIEGRIVTGGMGSIVKIIHSGLTALGLSPNSSRSSSLIFSSLALISIGLTLFSLSRKIVGFSKDILGCRALQWGHLLMVLSFAMISFMDCLRSSIPFSFSTAANSSLTLANFALGIRILLHSLQVLFNKFRMMFMNLMWMTGRASSI